MSQAFRWTDEAGMTELGDVPGAGTAFWARGVSADGSVVVGSNRLRSVSLDGSGGSRDAASPSRVCGHQLATGPGAVSADGSVVVGSLTTGRSQFSSRAFVGPMLAARCPSESLRPAMTQHLQKTFLPMGQWSWACSMQRKEARTGISLDGGRWVHDLGRPARR